MSLVVDINHLPEEILERIFSFTSQYDDYKSLSAVCHKWNRIIAGLRVINRAKFRECFQNGQIAWRCYSAPLANTSTPSAKSVGLTAPTQRHSHSSVILNTKLYVFGGLSATNTSYNDLWTLDLNTKQWSRPTSSGSYPSPKAAASLLTSTGKQHLILYGGYSHPYSYPFNQQVNFFDELHLYDVNKCLWQQAIFIGYETPKLAGHSASIINKTQMVLFGGCNGSLGNKTNSVYCLDLDTNEWMSVANGNSENSSMSPSTRRIDGCKPEPRYGHTQITLDDERIVIVGGSGGPGKQFDDVWILHWPRWDTQSSTVSNAYWQRVIVENFINSPLQSYCIPFVRCDDKLVMFGKPRVVNNASENGSNNHLSMPLFNNLLHTANTANAIPLTISTAQKSIVPRKCSCFSQSLSSMPVLGSTTESKKSDSKLFKVKEDAKTEESSNNVNMISQSDSQLNLLNKTQRNTIKRLEALKKFATKLNSSASSSRSEKESKIAEQLSSTQTLSKAQNYCVVHSKAMQMFTLDISELIQHPNSEQPTVYWQLPIAPHFRHAPPETILYTVCKGVDEIIVFGGMEMADCPLYNLKSTSDQMKDRVVNKLHVMKPV